MCEKVIQVGPGAYLTQFTIECTIRDLGQEICQPSNPYANLAQIALQHSQINTLKNIYLELDPNAISYLPKFAENFEKSFVLLWPRDRYPATICGPAGVTVFQAVITLKVRRWG